MALELRQQLKLTQQLIMTPQLQQAIKLLQLSHMELLEAVQQELQENPFLEESLEETPQLAEERRDGREEDREAYTVEAARNADWEDYLGEFSSTTRQSSVREFESPEDGSGFESRFAGKPTLESHLGWQLHLSKLTEQEKRIGEAIIGNLSSSGYLQTSVDELAALAGTDTAAAERVLKIVQRFDPVGVAARTPQECLTVQLEVMNYQRDPILLALVTEHLGDLEARRYKPLLRKFKLTPEDLKEYLDIIRSLDPMPGAGFGGGEPMYVAPDVYVYRMDDEFIIVLNEDGLPKLQLSSLYETGLRAAKDADKEYFQEKMRAASWLIKSLHQRQRTLYKVMESIVRFQKDFFLHGVAYLKPLILKDIAEDINMHESTVSRITSNKYAATPFGIHELKFFFNSALSVDNGSDVGSESVKALLKQRISSENPEEPLSDEQLGELLKEELNVNIARRTVAKYRTALGLASSSKRKKYF
ncbi:MAG: RNA polymerase factor sigma-54 [Desulfovibrio sp.]|jgi:RNA polymerase sigma-54 factor|nr:RNA polymerase factor sigma-54 [Desulfovibrio sp.]